MSDLTEALKAWWTNARDGLTPKQRSEIRRAARLVADGKVIPAEDIDYEAAWERYYVLADRRNKEGLTALMLRDVIDAALHLPGDKEHRG